MAGPNLNTFAPQSNLASRRRREIPPLENGSRIIVVGAGAFGGWSALHLLRKGFRVTLIDAWGGGNSRSSSGDETRVIRSTYGANETYFDLNVRALELWKAHEKVCGRKLFHNTGVLWFCYEGSTPLVDASIPFASKHHMDYEYLTNRDVERQYPLIHTGDLHHVYRDPFGGYLKARESVLEVQQAFIKEGGTYIQDHVTPGNISTTMDGIQRATGDVLHADAYLFACGSWLGKLFPEVLGSVISCTKQEVYYLGPPYGYAQAFDALPVWVDVDGRDYYYGIPGNSHRGFKIGVDIRGEPFDPTSGERNLTPSVLKAARSFIAHRFPKLKDAPLVEHRVCPYENSPDGNFIFDVHPSAQNVIFLGGGSGHGFKHGPALGELVADCLSGQKTAPEIFCLHK